MISTQQDNIVWVLQLEDNQQADYFWTVVPSIDIVTKKDIFNFIGQLQCVQQIDEIMELAMYISKYVCGTADSNEIWLLIKYFLSFPDQIKHKVFRDHPLTLKVMFDQ